MEVAITNEEHDKADMFEMPFVEVGAAVFFYDRHDTQHPQLGFVARKSRTGKNIVIRLATGHVHDTVRHVDDPKLAWNVDHREGGSWDFTDEWKRLEREREQLKARIDALELKATKQTTRRKKTTSS